MTVRIGVVGTGALGRHHVRLLAAMPDAELVGIFDLRHEVAQGLAAEHGTRAYPSLDALAGEVEAMVVAVPTVDHASVSCQLLEAGLHVLVEKPIAPSLGQADEILASAGDRILAVGHVEFFNPAVQRLLAVDSRPRYLVVERLAQFSPRSLDIDVVLDLMIHDLQILQAMDGSEIEEVRAVGVDVLTPRVDIANARLELASGCVANLTASRVSPERSRQLRVFLTHHYYSLDYEAQTIKGLTLRDGGNEQAPLNRQIVPDRLEVERDEPLRRELECFVARCAGGGGPIVTGEEGRRALAGALAIAKAIDRARS